MAGPPAAVAQLRSAVRPGLTGDRRPVLVACSGGADSLALAAAALGGVWVVLIGVSVKLFDRESILTRLG